MKKIDFEAHFVTEAWVDALYRNKGYPKLVEDKVAKTRRMYFTAEACEPFSDVLLGNHLDVGEKRLKIIDAALEAVSIGSDGAFGTAKPGTIYIDMSTVSPAASAHVAEVAEKKGIKYLRAPVSGSTALAAAGTLTIFACGPKEAYDQCVDIFGAMGQKCFYVGTGEEARYLKLVLNMMVGLTSAMTAETLTFGERGGMDWNQMIDIVNSSVVASSLVGYKVQMLKDRDYTPAFTAAQMAKDFDIALDTGKANNVPMPVTSLVRQFLGTMQAQGKGDLDFFGLVTLMEELAGLKTFKTERGCCPNPLERT